MKTKTCTKCNETKPLSKFHKNSDSKDGRQAWCKACCRKHYAENRERILERCTVYNAGHREEKSAYDNKHYAENRDLRREEMANAHLQRKYNITLADYDAMLEIQEGGCAICGKTPAEEERRLAVDHNHETCKVRGLLCNNCNRGVGHLQESPRLLRCAANYLEGQR